MEREPFKFTDEEIKILQDMYCYFIENAESFTKEEMEIIDQNFKELG